MSRSRVKKRGVLFLATGHYHVLTFPKSTSIKFYQKWKEKKREKEFTISLHFRLFPNAMNSTFFMRNAEKILTYHLLSAVTEIANCSNIAVSTQTSLCQSFATYVPYFDKTIK